MTNSGQLLIFDGLGGQVWEHPQTDPTVTSPGAGLALQLLSGGRTSCLATAAALSAPDGSATLRISASGQLQLKPASGASVLWYMPCTTSTSSPFQACMTQQGQLQLTGRSAQILWASSGPAAAGVAGPYTALMSGTSLEVSASVAMLHAAGHLARSYLAAAWQRRSRRLLPRPLARRAWHGNRSRCGRKSCLHALLHAGTGRHLPARVVLRHRCHQGRRAQLPAAEGPPCRQTLVAPAPQTSKAGRGGVQPAARKDQGIPAHEAAGCSAGQRTSCVQEAPRKVQRLRRHCVVRQGCPVQLQLQGGAELQAEECLHLAVRLAGKVITCASCINCHMHQPA